MKDPRENEILIEDFFDNDKKLIKELIYNSGEDNVQTLGIILHSKEVNPQNKKEIFNDTLTINQIRKFYDSFLKIYYSKVDDDTKKIQLLMLKANAEYSAERLKTKRFALFMHNRISLVVKQKQAFKDYLDAFKLHFEALVGYYPREKKEKEN